MAWQNWHYVPEKPHGHGLYKKYSGANAIVLLAGTMILTLGSGVLAIDLPTYFVAQNQLQTTVNAAAIAGAYELPMGAQQAEDAAAAMAEQNPVAGKLVSSGNLRFSYGDSVDEMTMQVDAKVPVQTIIGKMLCKMGGGSLEESGWNAGETGDEGIWEGSDGSGGGQASACSAMVVAASAKAVPAARDSVLVIDTSSSMLDGVQPIKAVKTAAKKYVDLIDGFDNQSVDRIGLVDFNRFGFKQIGLTAKRDYSGNGFSRVKSEIDDLKTYSSSTPGYVGGWNTNYYIGLKTALDEIEANGRKNAKRNIVFLTDGKPNLPAPPNYYQQYGAAEYRKCMDPVENSSAVRNLDYTRRVNGQTRYYAWSLPYTLCYRINNRGTNYCQSDVSYNDHAIKHSHVRSANGHTCTQTYVDYMVDKVEEQIERAKRLNVTIHTIEIYDPRLNDGNSIDLLQRLLTDLSWDPGLVEKIAEDTEGQTFSAETSDTSGIIAIYELIAKDIKVKLAY
ncbi:MAG: VWA domain-containing protein [Vampirovibrionales bacterium]|nr:VWA domain-containing protein [Vampirovibrionales bacterium]